MSSRRSAARSPLLSPVSPTSRTHPLSTPSSPSFRFICFLISRYWWLYSDDMLVPFPPYLASTLWIRKLIKRQVRNRVTRVKLEAFSDAKFCPISRNTYSLEFSESKLWENFLYVVILYHGQHDPWQPCSCSYYQLINIWQKFNTYQKCRSRNNRDRILTSLPFSDFLTKRGLYSLALGRLRETSWRPSVYVRPPTWKPWIIFHLLHDSMHGCHWFIWNYVQNKRTMSNLW